MITDDRGIQEAEVVVRSKWGFMTVAASDPPMTRDAGDLSRQRSLLQIRLDDAKRENPNARDTLWMLWCRYVSWERNLAPWAVALVAGSVAAIVASSLLHRNFPMG